MDTIYFPEAADGIEFLMTRTDEGHPAVLLFGTAKDVEQFIAGTNKQGELRVGQRMGRNAIVEWLTNAQVQGVSEIVIDANQPSAKSCAMPISEFLLSLDLF